MKTEHQQRVEEFMRSAGQDVPSKPMMPSEEVRLLRAKLILEEALETIEALGCRVGLPLGPNDWLADHSNYKVLKCGEPNMEEIVDGCADISVVTIGTLSACGVSDEPILEEVDAANLRKFGPDSYRREDGKQMKPPGWQPPNIEQRIAEQESREMNAEEEDEATLFDIGDLVRHRASGRKAIIVYVYRTCMKHHPLELCSMRIDRSECQIESTGYYDLSFDFGEDEERVDGLLLERVQEERGDND